MGFKGWHYKNSHILKIFYFISCAELWGMASQKLRGILIVIASRTNYWTIIIELINGYFRNGCSPRENVKLPTVNSVPLMCKLSLF